MHHSRPFRVEFDLILRHTFAMCCCLGSCTDVGISDALPPASATFGERQKTRPSERRATTIVQAQHKVERR